MATTTPVVESLIATASTQDMVDISGEPAGSFARISSILISNGLTAGTLTIKQIQNTQTMFLTNGMVIPASGDIDPAFPPRLFDLLVTQNAVNSKLTIESAGSADIHVTIYYFIHNP